MGQDVKDLTASFVQQNGGRDLNAQNVQAFLAQLQAGGAFSPQDAFGTAKKQWSQSPQDAYGALQGAYGNINRDAGAYADAATSPFGQSMLSLAAQQSQEAVNTMSQKMAQGGVFGADYGAARSAMMQGAMQPYAAANAQIASKRADAYNAYAQPQQQGAMANYYGMGDRYANTGNSYLNALAGMSQQAYVAPQFQTSPDALTQGLSYGLQGAAAIAPLFY